MDSNFYQVFVLTSISIEAIPGIFALAVMVIGMFLTFAVCSHIYFLINEQEYDVDEKALEVEELVLTEHFMVLVNSDAEVKTEDWTWYNVSRDWDAWVRYGSPVTLIV